MLKIRLDGAGEFLKLGSGDVIDSGFVGRAAFYLYKMKDVTLERNDVYFPKAVVDISIDDSASQAHKIFASTFFGKVSFCLGMHSYPR